MKKLKLDPLFMRKFGLPIGLILLLVLLQLCNMGYPLLSFANIKNILTQNTATALTALGVTFIMISGEGDMSFSGMFSLLTAIFAISANFGLNYALSLLVILLLAVFVNMFIANLITKAGFSSFIISIAFMFMANGAEAAIHQQTTLITAEGFKDFIQWEFGFTFISWVMLAIFAVAFFVIHKTKFGFQLRVTGENPDAAIEAGINIKRMKITAYLLAALCISIATSFEAARSGAIYNQGASVMLPVFAACYLGSSMFVPGRVNVAGTLFGALFVSMIDGFMKMIGVESFMVYVVQGIILVLSVGISVWSNRKHIVQVQV